MPRAMPLLAGALLCGPVLADDLSESMFLSDQPMVLTASRIQQSPLDAPAPVTVIDRETIRASGFTEIQDLMRLVPGFQVADWYQGSSVVANHGMGSAYPDTLLVLLDGQSVVDPITGSVNWQDLPVRVQDIERIEVVRGPNQASYGAGAYNGVINIITRTPGEDTGGVVSVSSGKYGFKDRYARIGRRGDSTDWRISASDRDQESFQDVGGTPDNPTYKKYISRQTFMANVVHRLGPDQEIDANLGMSWGRDQLGSSLDISYPYHNADIGSQFLQVAWHASEESDSETYLRYTHYGHQRNEAYAIGTGLPAPYDSAYNAFDADISQDGLEFQRIVPYSDSLKGVWGTSLMYDRVTSQHYFYGEGTVGGTTWQAYSNLDWRFKPDWLLHVGGMLENRYNTDLLFSPRVALNYSITPSQSLRASVGSGYRAPSLMESNAMEMYDLNGMPVQLGLIATQKIKPEQVQYSELGYVGRFDEIGLQLDGRVYAEHYSQFINNYGCGMNGKTGIIPCTLTPPPGYVPLLPGYNAYYFANAGDIRVYGEDLSADWRHPVLGRFLVSYALTTIHPSDIPDPSTGVDIHQSAPVHSFSLLWMKSLPWGLSTSVGYYHVGYMKWMGDGDIQPEYERVDLRLAKRLGGSGSKNEIALTLQGTNAGHSEFRPESIPVRQAFVTLQLGW
jgi:iron complex outermembrane receptor protein